MQKIKGGLLNIKTKETRGLSIKERTELKGFYIGGRLYF
jgi:hypothetical protein